MEAFCIIKAPNRGKKMIRKSQKNILMDLQRVISRKKAKISYFILLNLI